MKLAVAASIGATVLLIGLGPAWATDSNVSQGGRGDELSRVVGALLDGYDAVKMRGGAEDVTNQVCKYVDPEKLSGFDMPGQFMISRRVDDLFGYSVSVSIAKCGWLCLSGDEMWITVNLQDLSCHAQINPTGLGTL